MRVLQEVAPGVWKLTAGSNLYLLDFEEPVVIDTGNRSHREHLLRFLDKVRPLGGVRHVVFTHLHYDHIGNFDLFTSARFYASEREIAGWRRDPAGAILDQHLADRFAAELRPAHDLGELYVIATPGHTAGSICLWYAPERILFSGDTLFHNRRVGRQDLPTSAPAEMRASLMRLVSYNYRLLLPGHD